MIILGLAIVIYIVTYIHQNSTSANPVIFWAIKNNLPITITFIILSGFIGHVSSAMIYKQLTKTKKESQKLLEMLFLFLNNDEKEIINHLLQKNGLSGQAEISRLPGMDRVKAFRSLTRMREKNLVEITAHGKIRKVSLKEDIFKKLT